MIRVAVLNTQSGTWAEAGFWLDSDPSKFQLIRVEGLNPPPARLNWQRITGHDGSRFQSGTTNTRNIVLTISLTGTDAEATRQKLYYYFTSGNHLWVKIIPNEGSQELTIQGYVDTVENSPFDQGQTVQVSIICPRPFFSAELTPRIQAGVEFTNSESVPAGYELHFEATEDTDSVTFRFMHRGAIYRDIVVSASLQAGQWLEVRHNLSLEDNVTVDGVSTLGSLPWNFTWPELEPGETYSFQVVGFTGTSQNPRMRLQLYRAGV